MESQKRVIVIGAGAAGIIAAWRAATLGAQVTLLEKNERVGTKILISGNGKCNITHTGTIEEILRPFRNNEAKFVRRSFYRFTNTAIQELLAAKGLQMKARPDGRIFPENADANTVVAILLEYLAESAVRVRYEANVTSISVADEHANGVYIDDQFLEADSVIIATGGSSYPGTGSTGDGWRWARDIGHTIVKPRAALAPIYLEPIPPEDWSGVSLRNVTLRARLDRKEVARDRGDVLFTYKGISGPAVLKISRDVAEAIEIGEVTMEVDLLPDYTVEMLNEELIKWSQKNSLRAIGYLIDGWGPQRLTPAIFEAAKVDGHTVGNQFGRESRNRLVATLKAWPLGVVRTVPLEKGEVVAGGVSLDEVDRLTMRSSIVKGLFLCGEVLDVAGPVGGYNLQTAFSTGYVAGDSAVQMVNG